MNPSDADWRVVSQTLHLRGSHRKRCAVSNEVTGEIF